MQRPWTDQEILALYHNGAIKVLQRRLAKLSGVNEAYVSHWSNGDAYSYINQRMDDFRKALVDADAKTTSESHWQPQPKEKTWIVVTFTDATWRSILIDDVIEGEDIFAVVRGYATTPIVFAAAWHVPDSATNLHAEIEADPVFRWERAFGYLVDEYDMPVTVVTDVMGGPVGEYLSQEIGELIAKAHCGDCIRAQLIAKNPINNRAKQKKRKKRRRR